MTTPQIGAGREEKFLSATQTLAIFSTKICRPRVWTLALGQKCIINYIIYIYIPVYIYIHTLILYNSQCIPPPKKKMGPLLLVSRCFPNSGHVRVCGRKRGAKFSSFQAMWLARVLPCHAKFSRSNQPPWLPGVKGQFCWGNPYESWVLPPNISNHQIKGLHINLVGGIPTPLKNISSSVGMMTFLYGKKSNVPNHQPEIIQSPNTTTFYDNGIWRGQDKRRRRTNSQLELQDVCRDRHQKEVRNANPASQKGDKTQVVSCSYMTETWSIEVTSKRTY